jgi:hypothetical protein
MGQKTKINAEDGKQELLITREFDLPLELLFKAYAYAGFFFAMSGAVFSHIAIGDPMKEIFPALLLLILTVVSWYFRPENRKIISVIQ